MQEPLYSYTFLKKNDFYTYYRLRNFGSLKYPGFLPTRQPVFFSSWPVNMKWEYFDDRQLLPLTLPSTIFVALSLFLNHHRCLF